MPRRKPKLSGIDSGGDQHYIVRLYCVVEVTSTPVTAVNPFQAAGAALRAIDLDLLLRNITGNNSVQYVHFNDEISQVDVAEFKPGFPTGKILADVLSLDEDDVALLRKP
jgi:hypothetical protein